MRRFLVITIPSVTLILFIVVMLSGEFLKGSLGNDDNIPQSISIIMQAVNNENWDSAERNTERLAEVWEKVVKRIQFSSERDEINDFSASIARLRGAIQGQDKSDALSDLNEAYEHWDELGN